MGQRERGGQVALGVSVQLMLPVVVQATEAHPDGSLPAPLMGIGIVCVYMGLIGLMGLIGSNRSFGGYR